MPLAFTKMHGLGNDYVYISLFDQAVSDAAALARTISDRHRGVGSDGLILVAPPRGSADVCMIMYNADGSRSQMCGNGVRCVAKLAYERGWARRNPMRVETDRGVLELFLTLDSSGNVSMVRVDMGEPILAPAEIPVRLPGKCVVDAELKFDRAAAGRSTAQADARVADFSPEPLRFSAVSMGNPHAVFHVEDVARVPLCELGPRIENHPLFPQRVNAHFVQVLSPQRVRMITWERGTGPTQACGTGASAVCVAGVLTGRSQRKIVAELPGGELWLEWADQDNHVFMTGPATEVFTGTWPDEARNSPQPATRQAGSVG